ncbi:MAG: flavin monoamine oxidase family protein [Chloroflexota bacterium]
MTRAADVAVIGAGFAGLSAARTLRRAGTSVVVLEARDRVGGRAYDVTLDDGTVLELGGQWIGPTQARIHDLLDDLGIATTPSFVEGETVTVFEGEAHRHTGTFPADLGAAASAAVDAAFDRLETLAAEIPLERPWAARDAERMDGQTMAAWLDGAVSDPRARALVRSVVESMFVRPAGEVSLLDFLFHARTAGSLADALGFEGAAQQDRIVGGPQAVAKHIAAEIGEGLVLSAPARRIEQGTSGLTVKTDRGRFTADRVVVAVSPMLAGRIEFDPPLPALRDGLAQHMPHGSVIKIQVVYATPFWRAAGLSGMSFATDGAVSFTADSSPPGDGRGVLVGFIEGREARRLGAVPAAARAGEAIESLVRAFGPAAADVEQIVELDWSSEPWTRGCYSGHMAPGAWTAFGPALREPCGRIHWAGTETATWMAGYVDGAIASGERAAAEIVASGGAGELG